jgi:hypothetical protein
MPTGTGLYTPYNDATQSNAVLTPRLWKRAQFHKDSGNPTGAGATDFYVPNFKGFGGLVTSNVGQYSDSYYGHYTSYEDTGGSISTLATDRSGVLRFLTDTTDNDENWLQPGSATSVSGVISDTAADAKMLIFEARVRYNKVADNEMASFVGLSEEGCAVANTMTDNDGILVTTKDFIGFHVLQADGDALLFRYQKASQTPVTVLTYGTAITAAAWMNLAFIYDPSQPASKQIAIWVDGVEQTTYVTGTNIAAATFPDAEELQPLFGMKNGSGAAASMDLAGFRFYQEN